MTADELVEEAKAVWRHFRDRPTPERPEDMTEEDAEWIARFDRVWAEFVRLGYMGGRDGA